MAGLRGSVSVRPFGHGTVTYVTGPYPFPGVNRPDASATDAGVKETTELLLALVARGDQNAFERLYDRIAGSVLRTLESRGCSVQGVSTRETSLEDAFIAIVGRGLDEAGSTP